ncbi:hypothetical protein ACWJU0_11125 [Clostridioides difficile]|uniref:hypothetical protein n=1 Tax=Clostridioides difficile TaxID=1496 RepID=UPI000824B4A0|nr:hypothetical protein [Clostridioides difficile]HBG7256468.1 hypothetical protein [Clostridioides difficile]
MSKDYMALNEILAEMYNEENPKPTSTKKNYQRNKRDQFNRVIDLLGLDINDYKIEKKNKMANDTSIEYHIPKNEKVLFKYWLKNYKTTKGLKLLEKLEREKKKSNKLEYENISNQIKEAKDKVFIEMSFMIINEYRNNYEELTNIMDVLFTKNQYFFSKISENLYLETSKMIEPIFNNFRGEKTKDSDVEKDEYIKNYKVNKDERPLRLISQKESVILLLMYKDKIEKLGKELNELSRLVEEISISQMENVDILDNEINSDRALSNIIESIEEYKIQKEYSTWNETNFFDYDGKDIKSLLEGIVFKQKLGEIEISSGM